MAQLVEHRVGDPPAGGKPEESKSESRGEVTLLIPEMRPILDKSKAGKPLFVALRPTFPLKFEARKSKFS